MGPLLLKMGVAVSLSVAGYLYSSHLISSRRPDRCPLRRHRHAGADPGLEGFSAPRGGGLRDEIFFLQQEEARSDVANGAAAAVDDDAGASPQGEILGDEEEEEKERMLSEFDTAGVDMAALEPPPPLKKSETDCKKGAAAAGDVVVAEPEVLVLLKSLVRSFQERERRPEIPLPESAVVELGNRLKVGVSEAADLLTCLEIESLEAENRRLAAQAADHRVTRAELEKARARVRRLRRKLRAESLRARERVAVLQRRVAAAPLQDAERRRREAEEEAERRMARVRELEGEVAELRRANSDLAMANSDMAKKLESMQSLDASRLSSSEAATTAAMEESNSLREKNEELTKQLEQLQADNRADVEELVYLRWVNACLRHELQNHQPPAPAPGKTAGRDLSRTLSSRSEQEVKQLIHEYANSGGAVDERSIGTADFDSETCCSSSQASFGEAPEVDVAVVDVPDASAMKTGRSSVKKKFLSKLKKLVLSKKNRGQSEFDSPASGGSSSSSSARRTSASASSSDVEMAAAGFRASCDSAASSAAPEHYAKAAGHGQHVGGSPPWARDLSSVPVNFHRKPKGHLGSTAYLSFC